VHYLAQTVKQTIPTTPAFSKSRKTLILNHLFYFRIQYSTQMHKKFKTKNEKNKKFFCTVNIPFFLKEWQMNGHIIVSWL